MVRVNDLKPKSGSVHKKKRLGTGPGSGHGQTSTRGQKGQSSRSGEPKRVGFEGGQMPILRRIPKKGFNNKVFAKKYEIVKISTLEKYFKDGDNVNPTLLKEKGITNRMDFIKILGDGDLKKKINVSAHSFSKSAKDKIEKNGGKAEIIKKESRAEITKE
ncbi:MAG: 50S ribosomal protein L15 [Elusimicrobia bacterium]|nr:50S ribosomal protein L15 [Elusimicrobiota bacterium]